MKTLLIVGFLLCVIEVLLLFRRRDQFYNDYQQRKNSYPDGEGMMVQPDNPWPRE